MPPLSKRKRTTALTSAGSDKKRSILTSTNDKSEQSTSQPVLSGSDVFDPISSTEITTTSIVTRTSPKKKKHASSPSPTITLSITKLQPIDDICSTFSASELQVFSSELKIVKDQVSKYKKYLNEQAQTRYNMSLSDNLVSSSTTLHSPIMTFTTPTTRAATRSSLKLKKTKSSPTISQKDQMPLKEERQFGASSPPPKHGTGSKNLSRLQGKSASSQYDALNKNRPKPPPKDSGSSTKTASTSKPSIPNQVSIVTFWNCIDQYFKPIQEEHLKWLELDSTELFSECFIIPSLGSSLSKDTTKIPLLPGTLTSRLIAGLVEAKILDTTDTIDHDQMIPQSTMSKTSRDAIVPATSLLLAKKAWISVEERIKRDLASLGILSNELLQDSLENDEICGQLRQLQSQLRLECLLNNYRKKRLLKWILGRCAAQEYYQTMEILDKQIEASYSKKFKHGKKKKKGVSIVPSETVEDQDHSHHDSSLYKKKLLVDSFGDLIPSREQLQIEADSSLLFDNEEEKEYMKEETKKLFFPILPPEMFQRKSIWDDAPMLGLDEAQGKMSFSSDTSKKKKKKQTSSDELLDKLKQENEPTYPKKLTVKLHTQIVPSR